MTVFQAIILGIVQGLTEFIPISSTAHLIFAARLVGLYSGVEATLKAEQTTATIAVIQLGTLLAVLIYFARDIVNITRAFVGDHLALLTKRSGTTNAGAGPYSRPTPNRKGAKARRNARKGKQKEMRKTICA